VKDRVVQICDRCSVEVTDCEAGGLTYDGFLGPECRSAENTCEEPAATSVMLRKGS